MCCEKLEVSTVNVLKYILCAYQSSWKVNFLGGLMSILSVYIRTVATYSCGWVRTQGLSVTFKDINSLLLLPY